MTKTLRDRAVERGGQSDPRSTIDILLAEVRPKQRDEILDLLTGHPRIAHTVAADVLNEAFEGQLRRRLNGKTVEMWRRKQRQVAA